MPPVVCPVILRSMATRLNFLSSGSENWAIDSGKWARREGRRRELARSSFRLSLPLLSHFSSSLPAQASLTLKRVHYSPSQISDGTKTGWRNKIVGKAGLISVAVCFSGVEMV